METKVEVLPAVDTAMATDVLEQVDSLVNWHQEATEKAEKAGIRLARLIADVAANSYWLARNCQSEAQYIDEIFPQSRAQYYSLRRTGTLLRPYPVNLLESLGISKCQDLVRIHVHCGGVIPNNFFAWAQEESRDDFRHRVRCYVGKALPAAPAEEDMMETFKIWKSAIPIFNKAFKIAGMEAGTDKSKSHLLILILADYLAGHNEDGPRVTENQFHMDMIAYHIENLNPDKDSSCIDRILSIIRNSFGKLKKTYEL
jgi:hypothetical protein